MVPLALVVGLAAGFTRIRWWIVPLAAGAWTILLVFESEASGVPVLGGFFLAAANAAVGVAVSRAVVYVATFLHCKIVSAGD